MQHVAGQLPEYKLFWMPEGYTKYERTSSGTEVRETWAGTDTDPAGLPDSAPEVMRGGNVTLSVGTIIGSASAHANTLAWKDPETGLYFRIHGTADKETMIHIAEQVKKSS